MSRSLTGGRREGRAVADDKLTAALAAIKERAEKATPGPWWFDESDLAWRLHGVHAIIPPVMEGFPGQVLNHQILKAPKTGTPYAEYWPNEADAAFIVAARTDVPRLLAVVGKVLEAHRDAGGRCAWCRDPDGQRQKFPCGEYLAITRELTGKAADDA
jgi:hypothetical protein